MRAAFASTLLVEHRASLEQLFLAHVAAVTMQKEKLSKLTALKLIPLHWSAWEPSYCGLAGAQTSRPMTMIQIKGLLSPLLVLNSLGNIVDLDVWLNRSMDW